MVEEGWFHVTSFFGKSCSKFFEPGLCSKPHCTVIKKLKGKYTFVSLGKRLDLGKLKHLSWMIYSYQVLTYQDGHTMQ